MRGFLSWFLWSLVEWKCSVKKTCFIAIFILVIMAGCGYKKEKDLDEENAKLSEIMQEDIAEIKTQDKMIYLFIWKMDDLPRYGYWGYIRTFGMAIYDNGTVVYYDFGSFDNPEKVNSISQKEYIYHYIENADWESDPCIIDITEIDQERLMQYIVRVNRADAGNETTNTVFSPSESETTHEWEYYGVQQGEEPIFVFLRHELYNGATIIQNTDKEAQEAFELIEPVHEELIRKFDSFLSGDEFEK